jgi:hypothetical protein
MILNGFTNMTSTESSGEKENKMFNFTTNVPQIDFENYNLIKASRLLESIGNEPNPTANDFYSHLVDSDFPAEEHEDIILAAISIETMMCLDLGYEDLVEPTVH